MPSRSIRRDTIKLTVVQLILDCMSLCLNLWITEKAGSAAVGMIALMGTFFQFASVAAGGGGYVCASRFISEELGRKGNPERVFRHGAVFSLILGIPVSASIIIAAPFISEHFFGSSDMVLPVRILAFVLPIGGINACLKGRCNAVCRVSTAALCDILEFLVRTAILGAFLLRVNHADVRTTCIVLALSMAAGSAVSLCMLVWDFCVSREKNCGKTAMTFKAYLKVAFPVFLGGCLTSALSTANDALIPFTLRQSGASPEHALAQFGIFEAIVIPVLFFPSTVLCVLSGILLPEVARAVAAGDHGRLRYLARRSMGLTFIYSAAVCGVLLLFGGVIADFMGAEPLAGEMISLLAPVVPFIYFEIILEAIIKGAGRQRFSSMNYLAEYAVRITVVLVCIPLFGFYGIVMSYYTSNVFGNCMRFREVLRITGLRILRSNIRKCHRNNST